MEQEYNVEQTNKDKQIWTREESIVDPITSVTIIINTQITISRVNEIKINKIYSYETVQSNSNSAGNYSSACVMFQTIAIRE